MSANNYQETPFMIETYPALIKAEFIDVENTEKIRAHISSKSAGIFQIGTGKDDGQFQEIVNKYKRLQCCYDWSTSTHYNDVSKANDVLQKFKLSTNGEYLVFGIQDKQKTEIQQAFGKKFIVYKKYVILIFSDIILVFLDPANQPVEFLCALYPSALSVVYSAKHMDRTVVVNETSREPIEYYDKFNPLPQSRIISRRWTRTNADGSRSFAGGLKPENNPLHLVLEHGELSFELCGKNISSSLVVTAETAQEFAQNYAGYHAAKNFTATESGEQRETYEKAFTLVKKICSGKGGLFGRYKNLSPLMKCLIPVLAVFGGLLSIGVIIFIIEIITSALI